MMPDDNLILSALGGEVRNRTRRTRETAAMRRMVRETRLSVDNLIYPMFVVEGENVKQEISSMPGQYQLSVDRLVADCAEIAALDIPGVILFGIPDHKDDLASQAYAGRRRPCRTLCARSRKPAPSFASSRMFVFANTWITAIAASSRARRY